MDAGSNVGKIKIKNITDLLSQSVIQRHAAEPTTPAIRAKRLERENVDLIETTTSCKPPRPRVSLSLTKKSGRSSKKKDQLIGQARIDTIFKSASKNFIIPKMEPSAIKEESVQKTNNNKVTTKTPRKKMQRMKKIRRKRLFSDSDSDSIMTLESSDGSDFEQEYLSRKKSTKKVTPKKQRRTVKSEHLVDLTLKDTDESDKDGKDEIKIKSEEPVEQKEETSAIINSMNSPDKSETISFITIDESEDEIEPKPKVITSIKNGKVKQVPPYKIVEDTTFAVDAFDYGDIPNVTHYFLTHYHADHYIGLSGKFQSILYATDITIRLISTFMPSVDKKYLRELELNNPVMVDNVEVTAIDANHCPGAVMLIFKLPNGKCILHCGDFRACSQMESEPFFWNNDISLIYLDTTYLSDKYSFCHQDESIVKAIDIIEEFQNKHVDKKILYICGTYLVGKELFWTSLARYFDWQVWAEGQRYKSLTALNNKEINDMLCKDMKEAQLHVIPLQKLRYDSLLEYFLKVEADFDMLLALRPSGWEKNSRPQYRGAINIVGIEYSEHSSYRELERFVKFLKPNRVISTVPVCRDPFITGRVPVYWYKYTGIAKMSRNVQLSITSFTKKISRPNSPTKTPISAPTVCHSANITRFVVSPVKNKDKADDEVSDNFDKENLNTAKKKRMVSNR